jgi:organic hydroperoxide reductase OsmC/OhrA
MSQHTATVTWQRNGHDFTNRTYSRRHEWAFDGGLRVAASSSPHVVPLPYSDAAAVDPEEAYVAALSSCHMLWFLDFAARAGYTVESYHDDALGTMGRNANGKLVVTHVTLQPRVVFGPLAPSLEQLQTLHAQAHGDCFLANSVHTQITIEPQ